MKRILITGASSGIGQQLALDYAQEGYRVVACGRKADALEILKNQYPDYIQIKIFDITDPQAVQSALENTVVDSVILSAGTCEYINNGEINAELFTRVFDINVQGTINVLAVMLPQLKADSQISLMGSLSAWFPFPRAEAYGASKAAIAYLARSLAVSLESRKIRVSLIEPGFVDTPLTQRNDFPMPTIISTQAASHYIRRGLAKRKAHIVFPSRLVWAIRLLSWFPSSLQIKMARLMRKDKS